MSKNDQKITYEVTAQEDPETGDIFLPLPQEMLDQLGWKEGDTLEWKQDTDGAWIIAKS